MKNNTPNSICQNIKKYRLLNKKTQEEVAELLNLDTQYYSQLERGERNFTIEKIIRLCSIFNVGIEDIIEIETASDNRNPELVEQITAQIKDLSHSQLIALEKFITEVLPCVN